MRQRRNCTFSGAWEDKESLIGRRGKGERYGNVVPVRTERWTREDAARRMVVAHTPDKCKAHADLSGQSAATTGAPLQAKAPRVDLERWLHCLDF